MNNSIIGCIKSYKKRCWIMQNLLQLSTGQNDIFLKMLYSISSYDIASGSEITPCNKINKPLVVYRFSGNVMTSIIMLRT